METIWKPTIARKYNGAIDLLEEALRNCPDDLWEAGLWEVRKDHPWVWPVYTIDGKRQEDEATQERLLQWYSAFWNVAYHTIFHLDFYLSKSVLPYKPPTPFREAEHRPHIVPNQPYRKDQLLDYLAHGRRKARTTFESLTEEEAARPLPEKSQHRGQPFAELLMITLMHVQEHSAQLNLFLGQRAGILVNQGRLMLSAAVRDATDEEIDAFAKSVGGYDRLLPMVFAGLCAAIPPGEPCTVRFDLGSSYTVRINPAGVTFDKRAPKQPDATITVSPQDFLRLMVRDLDPTADGRLTIIGDATVPGRLFAPPSPARTRVR